MDRVRTPPKWGVEESEANGPEKLITPPGSFVTVSKLNDATDLKGARDEERKVGGTELVGSTLNFALVGRVTQGEIEGSACTKLSFHLYNNEEKVTYQLSLLQYQFQRATSMLRPPF